ncbi:MAG TPA: hypothetical protein VLV83_04865, partial [Acidobacteriota bacterium]|nr:hypothetical protein [Acidobacteriota bacterium]
MKDTSSEHSAAAESQLESKPDECVWCGSGLPAKDGPFGLTTRFHKPIRVAEGEVKEVPISIAHAQRTLAGFVRRHPRGSALLLTFPTCSQSCAETLFDTLQTER